MKLLSVRDDIKRQREYLKEKGIRARLSWFWTYYKAAVFVSAAVLIFVICLISSLTGRKKTVFNAVFFNVTSSDDGLDDRMESAFADFIGIDGQKEQVSLDLTLYQTPGNPTGSSYDLAAQTSVDAMTADNELDVIVADTGNFEYYLDLGNFTDLRDVLTEDQLEAYKDNIYYVDMTELKKIQKEIQKSSYEFPVTSYSAALNAEEKGVYERPDPAAMDDPVPVGIFVTSSPVLERDDLYRNRECVLGFVNGSRRAETSVKFLEYLMK